jgi:hypothetical protein
MRDEPGVQEVPDVRNVAAARVPVVIRNEIAKLRGIALLRRGFGGIDECTDIILGRTRRAARGGGERERKDEPTQDIPPTAACRR